MMARRLANLFRVAFASIPSSPSAKATKGGKFRRCWKHSYRYIRFFPLSASSRHLSGSFVLCVGASVFMARMLWTLSVPLLPEVTDQQVALLFRELRWLH